MSWKTGVLVIIALALFNGYVRPDDPGGYSLAGFLSHLTVAGQGYVIALVSFRDEIRSGLNHA